MILWPKGHVKGLLGAPEMRSHPARKFAAQLVHPEIVPEHYLLRLIFVIGEVWVAHLYLSSGVKLKLDAAGLKTSTPMQYIVAPAGTTVQLGWATFRLSKSIM